MAPADHTNDAPDPPIPAGPDDGEIEFGLLASHCLPIPATFQFNCHGVRFDAAVRRRKSGGAELVVRGALGKIPYSAESVIGRRHMNRIIAAGKAMRHAEIAVDRMQSIYVRGIIGFDSAPSPSYVAAAAAVIALAVEPVCQLINKCRMEYSGRTAG